MRPLPRLLWKCLFAAGALFTAEPSAIASGRVIDIEVVDRTQGEVLPVYFKDGQRWVVGTPGHEYLLRVRNREGGRVLAVMSVDGVNIVTGETASPSQGGYVLDGYSSAELAGWRKSHSQTAAFYFTDLGDAYATRTGRPDNVGIMGFAVFRERERRPPPRISVAPTSPMPQARREASSPPADKAAGSVAELASAAPAAPAPSLGTGHGRNETSYVERVSFVRATPDPVETITIRYDRRENLIAMGILPSVPLAGTPRAFPEWKSGGFVPDPPLR